MTPSLRTPWSSAPLFSFPPSHGIVLSAVRVKTNEEVVELMNSGDFVRSTVIFTHDGGGACNFVNDIQVAAISPRIRALGEAAYLRSVER